MKRALANIPMNIITGFLGAGKTTAIRELLKNKPQDEKWAVLVNEFGEVGIDGSLLAQDTIAVQEVPGGCMCCAAGLPSKLALNKLIKEQRPDRILIEPTGLAYPQQVLRQFSGPEYQTLLDIRATVCLVDPWCFQDDKFTSLPAFSQQIALADVLIASKADTANPQHLKNFMAFAEQQNKSIVAAVAFGAFDWRYLDSKRKEQPPQPLPSSGATQHEPAHRHNVQHNVPSEVAPNTLSRHENSSEEAYSCGWLIPNSWVFNAQGLEDTFRALDIPRIKGLINTDKGPLTFNKMRNTLTVEPWEERTYQAAIKTPSNGELTTATEKEIKNSQAQQWRLEMIKLETVDWAKVEALILQHRLG